MSPRRRRADTRTVQRKACNIATHKMHTVLQPTAGSRANSSTPTPQTPMTGTRTRENGARAPPRLRRVGGCVAHVRDGVRRRLRHGPVDEGVWRGAPLHDVVRAVRGRPHHHRLRDVAAVRQVHLRDLIRDGEPDRLGRSQCSAVLLKQASGRAWGSRAAQRGCGYRQGMGRWVSENTPATQNQKRSRRAQGP